MAANEEEIGLMKAKRYRYLLLLSSLLLILAGCSRRDVLDEYPVSGVQISLDWSGVTDQLPDGMRAIFYPKNAGGVKFDSYLSAKGGSMKVIPGRYSVVIYNYNTETLRICGEESYETIEAYTGNCSGLGIPGTDEMVWEPDPLYVVSIEDVKIEKSDEVLQLVYKPKPVLRSYSFQMKVAGLQYVSNVVGYVEGMANSYHLGTGVKASKGGPVFFSMSKTTERVCGCFRVFGVPDAATSRAEFQMTLTLAFIKTDNSMQTLAVDITEAVKPSNPEGGEADEEEGQKEIELPVDDENPLEIEKPTNPPSGGGGMGGEVGGWGDEDEVELPVN